MVPDDDKEFDDFASQIISNFQLIGWISEGETEFLKEYFNYIIVKNWIKR